MASSRLNPQGSNRYPSCRCRTSLPPLRPETLSVEVLSASNASILIICLAAETACCHKSTLPFHLSKIKSSKNLLTNVGGIKLKRFAELTRIPLLIPLKHNGEKKLEQSEMLGVLAGIT